MNRHNYSDNPVAQNKGPGTPGQHHQDDSSEGAVRAITSFQPHTPDAKIQAKFRGCLLGGAIGDALGAPVEFMSKAQIVRQFGPRGITAFNEFRNRGGKTVGVVLKRHSRFDSSCVQNHWNRMHHCRGVVQTG